MSTAAHVALIDADTRRRATISFALIEQGTHVEPFEAAAELAGLWERFTHLVIHDREDGSAAELIRLMGDAGHWLPVIVFAENPSPAQVVDTVLDGAVDFLALPFGAEEFANVLRRIQGRAGEMRSMKIRHALAHGLVGRLSAREREVLEGVANGYPNRAIAEQLAISPRTVEIHRANMLQKLGARHTSEAIRIALDAGLMDGPPSVRDEER